MSRNVSIVVLVVLALLAGAYVWAMQSPFPKAIAFDGRPFDRIDVIDARGTSNIFYAPKGQSRETALEFVQLVAFDDDVPEENRRLSMSYQHKSYGLKETEPDSGELFGTFKRGSTQMAAWGTVLTFQKGSAFVVHVAVQEPDFDPKQAEAATADEVAALQALTTTLDR